jgi:hypothetical protein
LGIGRWRIYGNLFLTGIDADRSNKLPGTYGQQNIHLIVFTSQNKASLGQICINPVHKLDSIIRFYHHQALNHLGVRRTVDTIQMHFHHIIPRSLFSIPFSLLERVSGKSFMGKNLAVLQTEIRPEWIYNKRRRAASGEKLNVQDS